MRVQKVKADDVDANGHVTNGTKGTNGTTSNGVSSRKKNKKVE